MRSPSTLLAVTVAAACAASPALAAPKPKPISGSYAVAIPVPFPMEASNGSHCADAPDGLSRDSRHMKLPAYVGKLDVQVSGFVGDWVIEIYDAKGKLLAYAASSDYTSGVRKTSYKKKKAPVEPVTVMVCNYAGSANGTVAWTFTAA